MAKPDTKRDTAKAQRDATNALGHLTLLSWLLKEASLQEGDDMDRENMFSLARLIGQETDRLFDAVDALGALRWDAERPKAMAT
jgi:hypothetical protein